MTDSPRVLVVAPHPQIYDVLQRLAAPGRFTLDWASDASRLDTILSSGLAFDAAVLDAAWSRDAGGIELAEKIRRSLCCGIVVIADHPQHSAGANGFHDGHDIYLQKPVKPAALFAATRQICVRRTADGRSTSPQAVLGTIDGFAGLGEEVLERIALATAIDEVPADEVILRENSRPIHLHAVLDGRVALVTSTECDTTVTEILGPGRPFVLAAVLADTPYIQAARTLAPSTILRIEASRLRTEIAGDPRLFSAMIGSLSRHDRMLVRQLADLKLRSAAQRLGCFLLRLSREQGSPVKVYLPCSKALLAAHLGMAPEHLSRAFVTLRSCRVTTQGTVVSLGDPQTLASFAKPDQEPWC